jgi:hypothetical protein
LNGLYALTQRDVAYGEEERVITLGAIGGCGEGGSDPDHFCSRRDVSREEKL